MKKNELERALILSNRVLCRGGEVSIEHQLSCLRTQPWGASLFPPCTARMHCRVTHLRTLLRERTGATRSLACCPRRTFSATLAHHATHYDTLSIQRNASKSQIKVSTLYQTHSNLLPCLIRPPSPPTTRYVLLPRAPNQKKKTPLSLFFTSFLSVIFFHFDS